jgi:hypothetical protein
MNYSDDFTRYYYAEDGTIQSCRLASQVPDEVDECFTIVEAVSFLQKAGCWGFSFDAETARPSVLLAAEIVEIAIEKYGEVFPVLYRGCTGPEPSNRVIKYGSPIREVAEFYGDVKVLTNVKGLRHLGFADSVCGGDRDEEVLFLADRENGIQASPF